MIRFLKEVLFFYKRKIYPGFKISKRDLVLDVGSGDKPFWRANVFYDNLSLGNTQRVTNDKTIINIGNFVDGDIYNMPFKDKIFDFVFCSHVLEHVDNPKKAIEEITRVGKSGYIEVPNASNELVSPFESHLWLIFLDKNKIIFIKKTNRLYNIIKNNFASMKYKEHLNSPFIRLYWRDTLEYEIVDELGSDILFPLQSQIINTKVAKNSLYVFVISVLRLFFKVKTVNINNIIKNDGK